MRPIVMTEEMVNRYAEELKRTLSNARIYKKITFSVDPAKTMQPETKPTINFNAIAYLKMLTLVDSCDTECAWHGIVEANEEHTRFDISDILVYPQTITGTTVQTDEVKYTEWKNALDDDTYNHLRMQGHSHVTMAATPSGVDTTMYENMLSVMNQSSYYIFIITNKRRNVWCEIHDLANNVIYETGDINITVCGENLDAWYKEQRAQFTTRTYSYGGTANYKDSDKKDGVIYGGPRYAYRSIPGFDEKPPYYDEDDDYDDAFSAYEGRAAMRQSAPKENKKRGRPRKEK